MVDLHSRYRMYGCNYNYTPPRQPKKTARDVHRLVAAYTPEKLPVIAHDCRAGYLQELTDDEEWRAFVLSHSMRQTTTSARDIHAIPKVKVRPTKLLKEVGERGTVPGSFNFPRALAFDSIGDIYITDSKNNRLQVFNGHGTFKFTIGGREDGLELNEPSGIAFFPNDDFAVADRRKKRVRVLASDGSSKFDIETKDEPYSLICDQSFNVVVSTYAGTLELYRRGGQFYNSFKVSDTACPISCNSKGEIIVSNISSKAIQMYDHTGKKLHEFKPLASADGLGVVNAGICVDSKDQILVSDSLNHTINIYTEKGVIVSRHLGPTDDLGSVQACAVGPQGHLAAVEFTSNGRHCLKIFRYTDCECHLYHKSPIDG